MPCSQTIARTNAEALPPRRRHTMARNWKSRLLRTPRRAIKPILANAMTALREASAWFGAFAYNEAVQERQWLRLVVRSFAKVEK